METQLVFHLANQPAQVPDALERLEAFLDQAGQPEAVKFAAGLVAEETLKNIMEHAYEDDLEHEIQLRAVLDDQSVKLSFVDDGKKFNPLAVPWQKRFDGLTKRLNLGLGLTVVRSVMESMQYGRKDGKNKLDVWVGGQ